jgi:PleD family two-component response regulator
LPSSCHDNQNHGEPIFDANSEKGRAGEKTPRLLIVDDDPELCDLLKQYLEPEGFEVHAVHSGAEGIR